MFARTSVYPQKIWWSTVTDYFWVKYHIFCPSSDLFRCFWTMDSKYRICVSKVQKLISLPNLGISTKKTVVPKIIVLYRVYLLQTHIAEKQMSFFGNKSMFRNFKNIPYFWLDLWFWCCFYRFWFFFFYFCCFGMQSSSHFRVQFSFF